MIFTPKSTLRASPGCQAWAPYVRGTASKLASKGPTVRALVERPVALETLRAERRSLAGIKVNLIFDVLCGYDRAALGAG